MSFSSKEIRRLSLRTDDQGRVGVVFTDGIEVFGMMPGTFGATG